MKKRYIIQMDNTSNNKQELIEECKRKIAYYESELSRRDIGVQYYVIFPEYMRTQKLLYHLMNSPN